MTMLAYKADPRFTRDWFLAEIQNHQDQDNFRQGWYNKSRKRGIYMGCLVYSINKALVIYEKKPKQHKDNNRQCFEKYLGIPAGLVDLVDIIFEGSLPKKVKILPLMFFSSIKEGADLSQVWNKLCPWLLRKLIDEVELTQKEILILQRVVIGYETNWVNEKQKSVEKDCYKNNEPHIINGVVENLSETAARLSRVTKKSFYSPREILHKILCVYSNKNKNGFIHYTKLRQYYSDIADKLIELTKDLMV